MNYSNQSDTLRLASPCSSRRGGAEERDRRERERRRNDQTGGRGGGKLCGKLIGLSVQNIINNFSSTLKMVPLKQYLPFGCSMSPVGALMNGSAGLCRLRLQHLKRINASETNTQVTNTVTASGWLRFV